MNSHLNVTDHRNTLPNIVELIHSTPPARRGAVLQSAISFRPSRTLDQEFAIGPVRAAFADYWEAHFCRPLPIEKLRRALEPPVAIKTLLEFSKFSITRDMDDIEYALQQLVKHLHVRFAELDGSPQQWLFDADRRCHEVKSLPVGRSVNNLQELVGCGQRFPTIYADPPWPYDNEASRAAAVNHYPTMSISEICAEPIPELAQENAHLHLWTTSSFLPDALKVIEAWSFEFKSSFVWIKPEIGLGNYWRMAHELLLLGVRGSLTFRDRRAVSWLQAHRTVHSRKPGAIRALIERVSPGPYLELYGREELQDSAWTVYGNQVERRLF